MSGESLQSALQLAHRFGFYVPSVYGFALVGIPLAIGAVAYGVRNRRRGFQTAVLLVLSLYVAALVAVTLFPIPVWQDEFTRNAFRVKWNSIPFRTVSAMWSAGIRAVVAQLIGNVLLFVPLGYLVPIVSERVGRLSDAVLLGLGCSVGIEASQFLISQAVGFHYKVVDVDDVLLNVLGVLCGYGLYRLLGTRLIEAGLAVVPTRGIARQHGRS